MLTLLLLPGWQTFGQNVQHLSVAVPGGMPGAPLVTGNNLLTNGVNVTWDGPAVFYQLFESSNTNNPRWVALTRKNDLLREATVPARYSNAVFKVTGPAPIYEGAESCVECHAPILNTYIHTAHASAFTNEAFDETGGQTNTSCLACHTVGFNLPTGFSSMAKTPQLAGVQCENCHGPAARHEANPDNPAFRPRAEIAAQVCGGCHDDAASPTHGTFAEWMSSGHAQATNFYANTKSQVNDCGRCHSGSVRLSLLEGTPLPTGDTQIGVVCVVCHDPHQTNGNPVQLRNPLASTNDYFMPTNGNFAKYYDPNINVCAQCHNHAGASWTNTAGEPHHSLQYNMYLGTVGELRAASHIRHKSGSTGRIGNSSPISANGFCRRWRRCAASTDLTIFALDRRASYRSRSGDSERGRDRPRRGLCRASRLLRRGRALLQSRSRVHFTAESYLLFFAQNAGAIALRRQTRSHPRLKIFGLLEARLMEADLMLLGGLDETTA